LKNKFGYYFLLILCICTFSYVRVSSYTLPLNGITIYIDPGHGGVDNGASYKDIYEDELNMKISYELKSELENKGAIVYLTRYDDYDLSNIKAPFRKKSDLLNRVKLINESNCNMYISIHLNSISSSKWKGVQVFYDDINKENIEIAKKIQDKFKGNRNIKLINDKYMYKRINKPGVLLELGFISNSEDRNNLLIDSKRNNLVKKISDGILDYYD